MTFVPQDDYPRDIECPLCLESFDSPVEALPCKHVFCSPCLTKLGRHAVCPLCRKAIATSAAAPESLQKQAALIQGHCDGSLSRDPEPRKQPAPPPCAHPGVYGQVSDYAPPQSGSSDRSDIDPCTWTGTRAEFARHLAQVQHHIEGKDSAVSELQAAKDAEDEASEQFQTILSALLGGMVVESPDEAFALMDEFAENRRARVNGWGVSMQRDVRLAMSHPSVRQSRLQARMARMSDDLDSDDDEAEGHPAQLRQSTPPRGPMTLWMTLAQWRAMQPFWRGQQGYQPPFVQPHMNRVSIPRTVGGPQTFHHHRYAAPQHVNHQGPPSQPSSIRRNDPYAQQVLAVPQYGHNSAPRHHQRWHDHRRRQNFGPGMSAQQRVPPPQQHNIPPHQQQHVHLQSPPSYHSQQHQQCPWNHQWGTQPPPPQQGALPRAQQPGQHGSVGRGPRGVNESNQGGQHNNTRPTGLAPQDDPEVDGYGPPNM